MRFGLYLKNLDEEYQISVYKGIRAEAEALGIDIVCVQGETLNKYMEAAQTPFPSRQYLRPDGVLLLSSVLIDHKDLAYIPEMKNLFGDIPCVSIGNRLFDFPSIIIKSRVSMERMMEHLIVHHGYRKLLFLGGPVNHRDNTVREHVFRRSINETRSKYPDLEGVVLNGHFTEGSGTQLIRQYLEAHRGEPLDAIVAANDNMALGALKVIHTASDPRWQRCAVTGFDDVPQAKLEVPPLTTVHQPLDVLGKIAVRTLRDIIEGNKVPSVIDIDSNLVLRSSCGCPAAGADADGAVGDPGDVVILRHQLARVHYLSVKSEQNLRNISSLGQALTTVESLGALVWHLRVFLNNLDTRLFFLFLYPNAVKEHQSTVRLVFQRVDGEDTVLTEERKIVSLEDFFGPEYARFTPHPSTRCVYHLMAGSEPLGLIVYEAKNHSHPHICSAGNFVANTIRRLRSLDDEKERSKQLEQEVALRTSDLVETNRQLRDEAKKRIAVEAEVLRISEMERLRFSLDLHDDICQRLAGISMFCKSLTLAPPQPEALTDLSQMIDETLTRTRQYAHDSFPVELDSLGLKEAFGSLCGSVEKQTGLACAYSWDAPDRPSLTSTQEINLYRIVQEAMHNVVKHSKATKAGLEVAETTGEFVVRVSDNGIGNPSVEPGKEIPVSGKRRSGLGLRSMQYRAHQIGAEFAFRSSATEGTLVEIRVPLGESVGDFSNH